MLVGLEALAALAFFHQYSARPPNEPHIISEEANSTSSIGESGPSPPHLLQPGHPGFITHVEEAHIYEYLEKMGRNIVVFYVGPEGKKYTVRLKPLQAASPYFRAKVVYGETEVKTFQECHFPDDKTFVFDILVKWLYGIRLSMQHVRLPLTLEGSIDVYIFAQRREFPLLKNEAIDLILHTLDATPQTIARIFELTKEFKNDKLQEICAHWCYFSHARRIHGFSTESLQDFFKACPPLLNKYLDIQPVTYSVLLDAQMDLIHCFDSPCYFHDHADGELGKVYCPATSDWSSDGEVSMSQATETD